MAMDEPAARAAAWSLLHAQPPRLEDRIRQDLIRLLDAMGIKDNLLTFSTSAGLADMYLPGHRTMIEMKQVGLADDPDKPQHGEKNRTPREQLEGYILAERDHELNQADPAGKAARAWTGILTDGKVWHAWSYQHRHGAIGNEILRDWRPKSEPELIGQLQALLGRDPIGKPWIPEHPAAIFEPYREQLSGIRGRLTSTQDRATRTKQRLWLNILRTSSIAPENEHQQHNLFVSHSFLIALARGVVHTLSPDAGDPDPEEILKEGFPAWIIESTPGRKWAEELLARVHSYEWRRRSGDVLRSVYETFIDARDRKIFGEYYTPDWLAALLVKDVCDDTWCNQAAEAALIAEQSGAELIGRGVLDPSCGSGTFLYHAARRILACNVMQEDALPPERKASAIARLVCGLDIHPVAVEISRATVLRALPVMPAGGAAALQVHQGDSLLTQAGASDSLFTHTEDAMRFVTPEGSEIYLPRAFARHRRFGTHLARLVNAAVKGRPIPKDVLATIPDKADRDTLKVARRQIEKIVGKEGNSVWSWYIANITAPVRLTERKVDRIVANPPWVKMADIQVPSRKTALERFSKEIGLWDGGKQAPHHDIASLFVRRCREQYLADPDRNPAAWIVKKTALKGDHWAKFREWHKGIAAQTLDLEKARPFGGGDARRCCVLFDIRKSGVLGLDARDLVANPSEPIRGPVTPDDAIERLKVTAAPKPLPAERSHYGRGMFRQGASISPSVLTRVEVARPASGNGMEVTTSRSTRSRWKDIPPLTGTIPTGWLRPVHTSTGMVPFGIAPAIGSAIVPVDAQGRLHDNPAAVNTLWEQGEALWTEHRSHGKTNPESLRLAIDFAGKLSSQLDRTGDARNRTVLYPGSGDNMRAARVAQKDTVLDTTLYYWRASSSAEAAYLVALLNAPALAHAFRQARSSNRHFHLRIWDHVPIPRYDSTDPAHAALAKLAGTAEKIVDRWMTTPDAAEVGNVGQSARIRKILGDDGVLGEIDTHAGRILPKHAG